VNFSAPVKVIQRLGRILPVLPRRWHSLSPFLSSSPVSDPRGMHGHKLIAASGIDLRIFSLDPVFIRRFGGLIPDVPPTFRVKEYIIVEICKRILCKILATTFPASD